MTRTTLLAALAVLGLACGGSIGGGSTAPEDSTADPVGSNMSAGSGKGGKGGMTGTTMAGPGGSGDTPQPTTPGTKTPPETSPPVAACPTDVAVTPLQRLTREQYANTVRDLLGTKPATDGIPADETVGTFFGNTVSSTTGLSAQQYMEAAEGLARTAITKIDALVTCDRTTQGEPACASQFITKFGLRAFRRPLTTDEATRYRTLYATYGTALLGGFANGIRNVLQTLLQSPNFLYHVEFAGTDPEATSVAAVGPYELASRLSYFLWNTMPDDVLFTAAGAGTLGDAKGLRAQVDRMLKDNRARDTLASFHLQWLDIDQLSGITKDPMVYPKWTTALRTSMRNETVAFVDYVVRKGDAKLGTLLTAPYSLIDAPMVDLYGVDKTLPVDATRPMNLDGTQRAGILTQASVLATHAHANESSPVSRGVLVRKSLLCQDLPDPPPNVNSSPPVPSPNATTRERFAEHEKNPSCGGCHSLIDGIGLGFENYDGIGAFRTTESGKTVDATGNLLSAGSIEGPFTGAVQLAKKLASSKDVQQCMARQWFRYALGRLEGDADACSLQRTYQLFDASGLDIRELLAALAGSDAFRMRRPPAR